VVKPPIGSVGIDELLEHARAGSGA